jgi:hypothetical protein
MNSSNRNNQLINITILILFSFILSTFGFLSGIGLLFTNGCTNDTEESKCEIPKEGHTYQLDSMLESGDPSICDAIDPLREKTVTWITIDEIQYDDGCKTDPDQISADKCSIKSRIECETGIVVNQSITWIDENKWNGRFTFNDNKIYTCIWSFSVRAL